MMMMTMMMMMIGSRLSSVHVFNGGAHRPTAAALKQRLQDFHYS
jgi:hypothetical protein